MSTLQFLKDMRGSDSEVAGNMVKKVNERGDNEQKGLITKKKGPNTHLSRKKREGMRVN